MTDLLKRLLVMLLCRAGSRAGVDWRRAGGRYHLQPAAQLTPGRVGQGSAQEFNRGLQAR